MEQASSTAARDGRPPAITAEAPARSLEAFLVSLTDDMAFSDEDPAAVVDRHYPSGIEQRSDGVLFDRERLIQHTRPVRRNTVGVAYEVHDALVSGDRFAARYTMRAARRSGKHVDVEVYLHGELDPDGYPRRIDQITRPLGQG